LAASAVGETAKTSGRMAIAERSEEPESAKAMMNELAAMSSFSFK
jgi:hypothetical protein